MTFKTLLSLVAEEFPKAGIRYMLIGGFAVNHHGISRNTLDMDFLVVEDDYAQAARVLNGYGYAEKRRSESCARLVSPDPLLLMPVDFLFVDPSTYEKMRAEASLHWLGGHSIMVPSVHHLIALKLHALKNNWAGRMVKDMGDIAALVQQHKIDIKSETFKALCLKFGGEAIYQRICMSLEGLNE